MHGVKGVVLFISPNKYLMNAGLDVSAIKTSIEIKLRLVGLTVLDGNLASNGQMVNKYNIFLEVDLTGLENPDKQSISYLTTIKVVQQVRLLRDPTHLDTGTTWEFSVFGYAGLNTLNKSMEDADKGINLFVDDYLAVNPKPSRVTSPSSTK